MEKDKVSNKIYVAVGIIEINNKVLISKRVKSSHFEGYWEFPGGKIEKGETVQEALQRELFEELNIHIDSNRIYPIISLQFSYSDRVVVLKVWHIASYFGTAIGKEQQSILWVDKTYLNQLPFLPANKSIINAILLPKFYMITGRVENKYQIFDRIKKQILNGVRLIRFRAPWLEQNEYDIIAQRIYKKCFDYKVILLLDYHPELGIPEWCYGVHLKSRELKIVDSLIKNRKKYWIAASCHNKKEIELANTKGIDFITLSPINKTVSHPATLALKKCQINELVAKSNIPVFFLGGMQKKYLLDAVNKGAQGIAAISIFDY